MADGTFRARINGPQTKKQKWGFRLRSKSEGEFRSKRKRAPSRSKNLGLLMPKMLSTESVGVTLSGFPKPTISNVKQRRRQYS